ncbi:hypothetical protein U8527_01805 [Kordia algicida OT-1]|uniref:Uncharacterized protein n=1 Tax=Kordia algicida OT-1 TaxID=391587 RepID=A9DT82_9FLAO|nr:hypothetical protein [Kordia algicida]EDP97037.1 hypothetical protein KAOT1_17778 [Kordia algicida OT-1]
MESANNIDAFGVFAGIFQIFTLVFILFVIVLGIVLAIKLIKLMNSQTRLNNERIKKLQNDH